MKLADICTHDPDWQAILICGDFLEEQGRLQHATCLRWLASHRRWPTYHKDDPAIYWVFPLFRRDGPHVNIIRQGESKKPLRQWGFYKPIILIPSRAETPFTQWGLDSKTPGFHKAILGEGTPPDSTYNGITISYNSVEEALLAFFSLPEAAFLDVLWENPVDHLALDYILLHAHHPFEKDPNHEQDQHAPSDLTST